MYSNAAWKIESGFAWRLKTLLPNNCIRRFSRKCGVHESTIRSYLTQGKAPGLNHLISIAEAGGVTIDWLATGRGIKFSRDLKAAHEMFIASAK